jgi:von Willebrand factor type A domain-containing protein
MNFHVGQNLIMRHRLWLAVAAALVLTALPGRANAQQESCVQRPIFINVEDDKGQLVGGLTAANFRATAGKEAVAVTLAEPAAPRRIVILLDHSGSMFDDFLYHASAFAITTMVKRAAPDIEFAFATYSNDFRVRKDLTSNHDELIETVKQTLSDKTTVWGPSAMLDASERGLEMFTAPRIGDAVLLVTDGGENKSGVELTDVERRFTSSDVRLFAVIVTRVTLTSYSEDAARKEISAVKKLIDTVGGEMFWLGANYSINRPHEKDIKFPIALDYHNVPDAADGILRNMATTYRLYVSPPAALTKPEDWKLEVTDNSGTKNPAVFVRYQSKLYPCTVPTTKK